MLGEGNYEEVLKKKWELAYKPGSVKDDHSSRRTVTCTLQQPTRIQRGPRQWMPIWSCFKWGLPCRNWLPSARCALTAPFHPYLHGCPYIGGSALCCTFRQLTLPRRYLALCPTKPGLSSPCLHKRRSSSQLSARRITGFFNRARFLSDLYFLVDLCNAFGRCMIWLCPF